MFLPPDAACSFVSAVVVARNAMVYTYNRSERRDSVGSERDRYGVQRVHVYGIVCIV